MKKIFKELDIKDNISMLLLIGVFSGIFGFIYEVIFYKIDLGYFVNRGSTYGPWIPIYFYGGIIITLISYRLKDNKLLVFFINAILSIILEYSLGYFLLKVYKLRLWNYYVEKWNFLNINGFICLRSVLFFTISSLFLIYIVIPMFLKLFNKYNKKIIRIIVYILTSLFLIDSILYQIIK